ncbi:hypothetical protein BSKO_11230 [Bryopsis sp. KO-2023]|nr:hypothetical protein BSKO_11230 [Bryopsis sp. KO-2023]
MENGGQPVIAMPYDPKSGKFLQENLDFGELNMQEGLFEELIQISESALQPVSDSWKAHDDVSKSGGTCSAILMCILFPCCAISKAMVRSDDLESLQLGFQSAWMHSQRRGNAALQEKLFERGQAHRLKAVLIMETDSEPPNPNPKSSKIFLRFDKAPRLSACSG